MNILAIETTASVASAALWRDGEVVALLRADAARKHAETVLPLVDRLLSAQDVALGEIDAFAVDVGPGSFTGVRIGVCVANAFAYAVGKPVIGINSLQTLCEPFSEAGKPVCAMIDARNQNAYAALYDGGNAILAPCAVAVDAFLRTLPDGILFAGDVLPEQLGIDAAFRYPDAGALARAAAGNLDAGKPCAVPLYLRPSQAERLHGAKG